MVPCAGDEKFDPSTDTAYTLNLAMQLMRMVTDCCRTAFLRRSGMLLRCVHVLRHIVAACPATPLVCITRIVGVAARHTLPWSLVSLIVLENHCDPRHVPASCEGACSGAGREGGGYQEAAQAATRAGAPVLQAGVELAAPAVAGHDGGRRPHHRVLGAPLASERVAGTRAAWDGVPIPLPVRGLSPQRALSGGNGVSLGGMHGPSHGKPAAA